MTYYVFKSGNTPSLYAITDDRDGAKLNADQAPWNFEKEIDLPTGQKLIGTDSDIARKDIETAGAHYVMTELQFKIGIGRE